MAAIEGTIGVTGPFGPKDSADTYATGSLPNYKNGGLRTEATLVALYAVTLKRRQLGMEVVVLEDGKKYTLITEPGTAGTTDVDWKDVTSDATTAAYVQQTGVIDGCELSVHPTNNQAVKIAPGILQFVDSYTDKLNPVITEIIYPGDPELVITGIATTAVTNIGIDISSADTQQEPVFTNLQKRDLAIVGQVNHVDQVQVRGVGTLGRQAVWQTGQTISDLIEDNGVTNKSGNDYSAASTDLTLKRTAGTLFAQGIGDDKNANILATILDDPILVFLYFYLDASLDPQFIFKIAPGNLVDPDNYVKGGVLTAVPTGLWSVQRISVAAGPGSTSVITYGREVYDSLRTALLSIEGEEFIPSPQAENVVRRCFMAIQQGTTDLSDASKVFFTPVDDPEIPQYIDNTNRGIIKFPTITQEGGLDISWLEGKIYDITSQEAILINASAGSQTLNDNAVNYLYWSTGATLTLSTTAPVEPQISVSKFNVQDGVIYLQSDEDTLNTQESNLLSGIANVFPSVVVEGLNVSPDVDVTNAFDVSMESGVFYEDLHKRIEVAQVLSRTTAMFRHFHTAGAWDSDTNAEIDNDFYDNGTDVTALTSNRYAKGLFITCGNAIHWIYPREQFTTIAGADLADLPEIPPGLVGLPTLTAYMQQQGDTAFATYPGTRWIDVRNQGGASGAASGSSVFADGAFKIQNSSDATKELVTDLSNITTATERKLIAADRDIDLKYVAPSQSNATYFSAVGSSLYDGLAREKARAGISQGITAAELLLPTVTNPIVVNGGDGATYTSFDLSTPYININAQDASVIDDGSCVIGENNTVRMGHFGDSSFANVPVIIKQDSGTSYLYADDIIFTNSVNRQGINVEGGTLNSTVDVISCTLNTNVSINIQDGQVNHRGINIKGRIFIASAKKINADITGDLDGDITLGSSCTGHVNIGGNWTGKLNCGASCVFSITYGTRTLTSDSDIVHDNAIVRINGKTVGNDRLFSPARTGAITTYEISSADSGTTFTEENENTAGDELVLNLPPAAKNLRYDFLSVRVATRTLTLNADGTDVIDTTTGVSGITSMSTIVKGSSAELVGTDLGRWNLITQKGQWTNASPALTVIATTSSRPLTYADVNAVVYNNTSAAMTLTFNTTLNANTAIGSMIYICRNFGTSGSTIEILTSGDAVVKSRANTSTIFIANPGATFNYLGFVTATKITATQWFLSGDVSDTAN